MNPLGPEAGAELVGAGIRAPSVGRAVSGWAGPQTSEDTAPQQGLTLQPPSASIPATQGEAAPLLWDPAAE